MSLSSKTFSGNLLKTFHDNFLKTCPDNLLETVKHAPFLYATPCLPAVALLCADACRLTVVFCLRFELVRTAHSFAIASRLAPRPVPSCRHAHRPPRALIMLRLLLIFIRLGSPPLLDPSCRLLGRPAYTTRKTGRGTRRWQKRLLGWFVLYDLMLCYMVVFCVDCVAGRFDCRFYGILVLSIGCIYRSIGFLICLVCLLLLLLASCAR